MGVGRGYAKSRRVFWFACSVYKHERWDSKRSSTSSWKYCTVGRAFLKAYYFTLNYCCLIPVERHGFCHNVKLFSLFLKYRPTLLKTSLLCLSLIGNNSTFQLWFHAYHPTQHHQLTPSVLHHWGCLWSIHRSESKTVCATDLYSITHSHDSKPSLPIVKWSCVAKLYSIMQMLLK